MVAPQTPLSVGQGCESYRLGQRALDGRGGKPEASSQAYNKRVAQYVFGVRMRAFPFVFALYFCGVLFFGSFQSGDAACVAALGSVCLLLHLIILPSFCLALIALFVSLSVISVICVQWVTVSQSPSVPVSYILK